MEIESYYGKKIIAFLGYNASYSSSTGYSYQDEGLNKICYIYPKFWQDENGTLHPADAEDFPATGRIDVLVTNGKSAEDVCNTLGKIVVAIITNRIPNTNPYSKTKYVSRYNPDYGSRADISIRELSAENLNLCQILSVNDSLKQFCEEKKIDDYSGAIYTTVVLVRIEDKYYGPFQTDKKGNCIEFRGLQDCDEIVGVYSKESLQDLLIEVTDLYSYEKSAAFIQRNTQKYKDFIGKYSEEVIDWITDDELLIMLANTLKNAPDLGYFKSQVRQIRKTIEDSVALENQAFVSEERTKRIQSLIQKGNVRAELLDQITNFILENSDASQQILRQLAEDKFDLIKDRLVPLKEIQDKINEKNKELQQIEKGIAYSRERAIQENKEEFEKKQKEAQDQLALLHEEIEQLNKVKIDLADHIDVSADIVSLRKKQEETKKNLETLQVEYGYQKKIYDQLEVQVKRIMDELKSETSLTAKLLERKLIDRVLKTVSGEVIEDDEVETVSFNKGLLLREVPADIIVSHVHEDLQERANRIVSKNDVINYLLCISQGFITVFAGEPGTGKTSLCHILAKSLGLAREGNDNRYIEVSVERGWSSHKDYIGYYNPLTKRLEKSNTQIFDAFQMLSEEASFQDNAPFFLLLDEANLSPIEHYWAPFLKLCDADSCSDNLLVLGGDIKWRVPRHLRFLATVNFDHTTEELSPRFLDRAWIITLEPETQQLWNIEEGTVPLNENTYDYLSLEAAFSKAAKGTELNKTLAAKWESIKKIFKDNNVPIMPRNMKMVNNYCIMASNLMEMQTEETKFAPLDYAVAQKILPTINGTGEKYRKLIDDLLEECKSMPISYRHLERMKEVAERNLGFYQYFAR